jgi:hypothetical protein
MKEPFAWVVGIKPAIPEHFPPEYYDQETIMGDYLRKLERYHHGKTALPSLERYLPQNGPVFPLDPETGEVAPQNPKNVETVTNLDDYAEPLLTRSGIKRDDMLREAGLLGVDLLGQKDEEKKG